MTLKPRTSREKVSDISEGVNISEIIEVQNALAQSIESR